MVYQEKMDLRKIKNSISLCIVKLKEDIYDIRYALVIITIYIIVTQIIFWSVCPMVIIFKYPCPACGLTVKKSFECSNIN